MRLLFTIKNRNDWPWQYASWQNSNLGTKYYLARNRLQQFNERSHFQLIMQTQDYKYMRTSLTAAPTCRGWSTESDMLIASRRSFCNVCNLQLGSLILLNAISVHNINDRQVSLSPVCIM